MRIVGRRPSPRFVLLVVFTALSGLALPGCGGRAKSDQPNIILITLDTVRADHTSVYGYERRTTPHLEAFAEEADLYEVAVASSPWTLPTHTAIFTGHYPFESGVHRYLGEGEQIIEPAIPEELPTITEVLRELGYTSGGYSANQAYLQGSYGFSRGFNQYRCQWMYGDQLNNYALRWFEQHRDDTPVFLFLNYMDAHMPYNTTPIDGLLDQPVVEDDGELLVRFHSQVMAQGDDVDEELRQKTIDQYDTGIAHCDRAVGEVLAWLKEHDLYENSAIIITSDHGELFGEHKLAGHGTHVYEGLVRVPLLVKRPGGGSARRIETPISLTAIPNLILETLPAAAGTPYADRFPHRPGAHRVMAENYYARQELIDEGKWAGLVAPARKAFYEWPYKAIESSDEAPVLFNVENDPAEEIDRAGDEAERLDAIVAGFRAWMSERPTFEPKIIKEELSEEQRETMRTLGYL